ncbi:MAG: CopD family protein [Gemmatimonadaceae bacterium]|jgi:putative copper export protein|nr:CopD family protein [Gemmatimonadaceae bacterium]
MTWLALPNALLQGGALLLAGRATALLLRVDRMPDVASAMLAERSRRIARVGGVLLVIGALLRIGVTAWAMADGEPLAPLVVAFTRDTWPGQGTALLAVAGALVFATVRSWWMSGALLVVVALLLAATGHATEVAPAPLWIALDATHAMGALLWIGGLLVIAPALRRSESGALLARFAPIALASAAAVVITGAARVWRAVWPLEAWWRVPYGQLLLVKLALVLLVIGLGARNWRAHRGRQVLDAAVATRVHRRAQWELIAASAVLLVTAWLGTTSPSD